MPQILYDGTRSRVNRTPEDDRDFPIRGGEVVLAFDPDTNPTLADAVDAAPEQYSIVGGQLRLNGTPVAINPDGEAENIRKGLATRIQAARNYIDNQSPTQAQSVAAIKGLLEFMIYVVQHREKLIN